MNIDSPEFLVALKQEFKELFPEFVVRLYDADGWESINGSNATCVNITKIDRVSLTKNLYGQFVDCFIRFDKLRMVTPRNAITRRRPQYVHLVLAELELNSPSLFEDVRTAVTSYFSNAGESDEL